MTVSILVGASGVVEVVADGEGAADGASVGVGLAFGLAFGGESKDGANAKAAPTRAAKTSTVPPMIEASLRRRRRRR